MFAFAVAQRISVNNLTEEATVGFFFDCGVTVLSNVTMERGSSATRWRTSIPRSERRASPMEGAHASVTDTDLMALWVHELLKESEVNVALLPELLLGVRPVKLDVRGQPEPPVPMKLFHPIRTVATSRPAISVPIDTISVASCVIAAVSSSGQTPPRSSSAASRQAQRLVRQVRLTDGRLFDL